MLFCENLVLYNVTGPVPENGDCTVPIGRAADRAARATDLTLVAHSYTVQRALRVADRLGQDGISVEVVDLRSLRPLDVDTVVESVRKTNRVLVAEEGWSTYGVGAELAARIQRACFDDLDAPVERVGAGRGADALLQAARAGRAAARVQDRGGRALPASGVRAVRLAPCPKS